VLQQIIIGALMVLLTTSVHGIFTYIGITALRWQLSFMVRGAHTGISHLIVSIFVLWMFVAHLIEMGAWAALYRGLGLFDSMETAFYFSSVTYTTLGYGDIVPEVHWRLLAMLEAANGFILFGWTTALVFAVLREFRSAFPSPQIGGSGNILRSPDEGLANPDKRRCRPRKLEFLGCLLSWS
jgi:hypothetical protein